MDKNILAVALGSMLLGGVAVAAYTTFAGDDAADAAPAARQAPAVGATTHLDVPATAQAEILPSPYFAPAANAPAAPRVEYATVVDVEPISRSAPLYARVIGTEPVRDTTTTQVPREVCEDVVVEERLPERDGNVGGTVAGAVIGGLLGNQVGGGNGKKAATAAGAAIGGFVGNRVDRNHVGGRVTTRVDRQCNTVMESHESSRVIGYNVTYRTPDGSTGSMRMDSRPGERIRVGSDSRVTGYDVTYTYNGARRTIRMDDRPGNRLPVVNGQVVTQAEASTILASRG